ncbi:MAG: carboxyl transferase domain-containing protein [Spirochaetota bacterium]|nr:carboxyl transferase domain-containing protein [Spirochaetota bacterium]
MGKWMESYLEKYEKLLHESKEGGGIDRVKIQHSLGKLTARERIERLADPGSFEEVGGFVRDDRPPYDGNPRLSPSEGIVTGYAKINGRQVIIYSMDFTVMSGSLGDQAVWKLSDLSWFAGQMRIPLISIIDSAGERLSIKDGNVGYFGLAHFFRNYSLISGLVPRISLVLGPCSGIQSVVPVLSDFLIMNREVGFLWLGGDKDSDDAGGADFHMERSGQCDFVVDSDEEAIEKTKELLGYLPQNCWEKPPAIETKDDPERMEESLLDVMPDDPKFTYDIHDIIELVVDDGEFIEIKEDFVNHLILGFCRFNGQPCGLVANNPDELSGIIEPDSSDKYDRFMNFLDAFNIPLVTLVDTTAFPPGDKWERLGVIRHGAKLLHSYAHLTCPKVTVVLRRSYGGGNIVMGCIRMTPDYVYGWPTMEFAPTGPETVVHAVFHKELARAKEEGNYDEVFNSYLSILKEQFSVLNLSRVWTTPYTVHEVIDPRETRPKIIKALQSLNNKSEFVLKKKRSIKPA